MPHIRCSGFLCHDVSGYLGPEHNSMYPAAVCHPSIPATPSCSSSYCHKRCMPCFGNHTLGTDSNDQQHTFLHLACDSGPTPLLQHPAARRQYGTAYRPRVCSKGCSSRQATRNTPACCQQNRGTGLGPATACIWHTSPCCSCHHHLHATIPGASHVYRQPHTPATTAANGTGATCATPWLLMIGRAVRAHVYQKASILQAAECT